MLIKLIRHNSINLLIILLKKQSKQMPDTQVENYFKNLHSVLIISQNKS